MNLLFLPSEKRRTWIVAATLLGAGAVGFYVYQGRGGAEQHGGTFGGLVFGIAAFALMLLLLLFGWRKRAYASRFGSLEGWLQAHVWLGLLTLPLVLLHTGFRFRDQLALSAFALMALVVFTGWLGAVLYTTLPARLSQVETKVSLADVSEQLNSLQNQMSQLASGRSPAFGRLHQKLAAGNVPAKLAGWRLLFGGVGRLEDTDTQWQSLLALVDEGERPPLRQLIGIARQHRELHHRLRTQVRYRHLLAAWLFLHVPLSLVLLLVTIAHVAVALYYRGI